jgi:hypothetical protein
MESDKKVDPLLVLKELMKVKPNYVQASPEKRKWWDEVALPHLKDHMLSQLHRNNEAAPVLVGFTATGDVGVIDVAKSTGGTFGSRASKDAVATVQRVSAMIPGTLASVFCCEAWALRGNSKGEMDRNIEKYPNLGDHPDRFEVMMFNMLSYDWDTNAMMQFQTTIEVIKVLGKNVSRKHWRDTKYGRTVTVDPRDPASGITSKGRFIPSAPDDDA